MPAFRRRESAELTRNGRRRSAGSCRFGTRSHRLFVLCCADARAPRPSATSTVRLSTSGSIGQRSSPIVRRFQEGGGSSPLGRRASTGVLGRSWSVLSRIAVTNAASVSGQTRTRLTATSRRAISAALMSVTRRSTRSERLTKISNKSSVSAEGCAKTSNDGAWAIPSFLPDDLGRFVLNGPPRSSREGGMCHASLRPRAAVVSR